jgi:outer membrane receptor for ferrienterochelin and colicins
MKRLLLAGVFFLCIGLAIGQVKVTIIDKGFGKTIEGVALYLKDSEPKLLAISNQAGVAEIKVDKFPATIVTSHISYAPIEFQVLSEGDLTIQLKLAVTKLDEVVVTGQYEPTSVRNSVYKVRVINEERIKAQGTTKLQDVLSTELNIRFTQDLALGVSDISMQGMAGQNVKVLLNGVPVVGRQATTNAFDLNQININTIERIEIIEGPMSTLYGADALAGVINIITKKPVGQKLAGSVKVHEETVGNEYDFSSEGVHQQNINVGYQRKSLFAMIDGAHTFNGGWQGLAQGRERQWNSKKQWILSPTVGIQKENWNAAYRLDYLNETIHNPAEFNGNEALDQNYITKRFMHQLQGGVTLNDKVNYNGNIAYTDYSRKTQTIAVDAATGEKTLALGAGQQDQTNYTGLTVRGTVQYKISDKISLQPGYDVNTEAGSGGRLKAGNNSMQDYALFLSAELKPFSFLSVRPGMRFIKNSVYQAPPVVPSINTKITLSAKHDLRLSYSRGFRAPSLRELYFNFFDASHSIEGNPNLEAELSHSFNASWNWYAIKKTGFAYTASVNGFYNSTENLITYGVKPTDNTITTLINVEKFKSQGITLNNTVQLNRLTVSAGIGRTGRFNQLNGADADLPDFTWSTEVNMSASYTFERIGLTTSAYYKYTGQTPSYEWVNNEPHLAVRDAFHWADVTIQKNFFKHFSATMGVRNLFDVTQVNSTSLNSGTHSGGASNAIGCGRALFLKLKHKF